MIKLFNDKLSNLRRELYREATDVLQKTVLKGTRWLLLINPENLDGEGRKAAVGGSAKSEQAIGDGLLLEGRSATILGPTREGVRDDVLDGWIRRARTSGIKILQQMAKTLACTEQGCWHTTT